MAVGKRGGIASRESAYDENRRPCAETRKPKCKVRFAAVENIVTGERYPIEWGGIRVRIDPSRDPAVLFRCLA